MSGPYMYTVHACTTMLSQILLLQCSVVTVSAQWLFMSLLFSTYNVQQLQIAYFRLCLLTGRQDGCLWLYNCADHHCGGGHTTDLCADDYANHFLLYRGSSGKYVIHVCMCVSVAH